MQNLNPQNFPIRLRVRRAAGKVVKGTIGYADDMVADEWRALRRSNFRMLQATLPLHYGPTRIVVLRHLAEYLVEVDLSVAQRTETSRPIDPILIAAIYAGAAVA